MAGIYVHIPFCRRKCPYCNFFSLATKKNRDEFIRALATEIALSRDYLTGETVDTVYFGGGTPSVYSPGELERVLKAIFHREGAKALKEITLELNPEDVDGSFVDELQGTSFNRFSLGVQSFSAQELAFLGRGHDAGQSVRAVDLLRRAGYENISIDLIYGIPGSDDAAWAKNLDTAFSLGVPHISAYALTVEEKTPLDRMIRIGQASPVDDERQAGQFRLLMAEAEKRGFKQYEISNFAREGWYARHNTNYWNGIPYLGLGPSAHSYNGVSRRWNRSNLSVYLEAMANGQTVFEEEILSPSDRYNEYIMTSLRTMWGCDIRVLDRLSGGRGVSAEPTPAAGFLSRAVGYIRSGWMVEEEGIFRLTPEGKLFADRIASECFVTG